MREATLTRKKQSNDDQGTFGQLFSDSGKQWCSIELPWRDNLPNISCVPTGDYICKWLFSPKHGLCFHLQEVPLRTDVEIHAANLAGDVSKGFVSQLLGCIALGLGVSRFEANVPPAGDLAQIGVSSSVAALDEFQSDLGTADFILHIVQGA